MTPEMIDSGNRLFALCATDNEALCGRERIIRHVHSAPSQPTGSVGNAGEFTMTAMKAYANTAMQKLSDVMKAF